MKDALFADGEPIFECPNCEASIVKYRYEINEKNKFLHWGECDFPTCRKHHRLLMFPLELPEDNLDLIIEDSKVEYSNRIISAELKLQQYEDIMEKDRKKFKLLDRTALLVYMTSMQLFLKEEREYNASLYLDSRFGMFDLP